jgi:hypothetical protein
LEDNDDYITLRKVTDLLDRITKWEHGARLPARMPAAWVETSGLTKVAVCDADELRTHCIGRIAENMTGKRKPEDDLRSASAKRYKPLFYVQTEDTPDVIVHAHGKRRWSSDDESDDDQWYAVTEAVADHNDGTRVKLWDDQTCLDSIRKKFTTDERVDAKTVTGSTAPLDMAVIHWLPEGGEKLAAFVTEMGVELL